MTHTSALLPELSFKMHKKSSYIYISTYFVLNLASADILEFRDKSGMLINKPKLVQV